MKKAPAKPPKDFAVFILSHARPNHVFTHSTLRRSGYTGPIYVVIDDLDKTRKEYEKAYGKEVVVFDKKAAAKITDSGDNSGKLGTVLYARNAAFGIAKKLGVKYFLVLDDDYRTFQYRFDGKMVYGYKNVSNLDTVLIAMLDFFIRSGARSLAMAQGGDFIGGAGNQIAQGVQLLRKCMNSFFCSTDRPFKYMGRMNDDVNTYVTLGSRGLLFFTINQICLTQGQTQATPGGLTEMYLESGTYVKSFYSVMYHPSSVKVGVLQGQRSSRIHHQVDWRSTVPKILSESLRKR